MPVLESSTAVKRDRESRLGAKEAIRNVATYQQPLRALYLGAPCTIIATGDLPGHSQVNQFVDEDLKLNWASEADFVVIDPTVMPFSPATLRAILQQVERETVR